MTRSLLLSLDTPDHQIESRSPGSPLALIEPRRPRWRYLVAGLKAAVSGALIYWILRDTSLRAVGAELRGVEVGFLLVAVTLYALRYYVGAFRWRVLLEPLGIEASVPHLFKANLVAVFFSNFLPSIIGGEPVRIYDSWRLGATKSGAVSVILVDRLVGMLALALFLLVATAFSDGLMASLAIPHLGLWISLGTIVIGTVIWAIFIPSPSLIRWLRRLKLPYMEKFGTILRDSILVFSGRRDALVKALTLSGLVQAAVILSYFAIAGALGLPVPLSAFFLIIPLSVFVMMLPISINAIGIRENVFVFFFGFYGVSKADAVAFAWLAYAQIVVLGVVGGIILVLRKEGRLLSTQGKAVERA